MSYQPQQPSNLQNSSSGAGRNQQQQYQHQQYAHHDPLGSNPPGQPPRRSDTELLPQGQERSEQMEYFQSYEATAPQNEDDQNQAILVKEFPGIDSSLIAAIYGDSKNLSATREMLQELSSTS